MSEGESGTQSKTTCNFFKKSNRIKGSGARKRQKERSSSEDDSDEESAVIRKERLSKKSLLTSSTSTSYKAKMIKKKTSKSDESEGDEENEKVKKLKNLFSYESNKTKESEGPVDGGATATLETETEHDRDGRAIFDRSRQSNENLKGKVDDRLYRGQNNYVKYVEAKDSAQMNAANKKGPIRAPMFLRATTRWDYQPDICKDYKETGTCGFGDTCKFLHDRGDYKSGWELEREWEDSKEEITMYEIDNENDDPDDLPFACFICRGEFKDPIVTRCRHYFCETCALTRYRQTTRCAVCNCNTGGVFNPAREIVAKLCKAEHSKVKIKDPDEDL